MATMLNTGATNEVDTRNAIMTIEIPKGIGMDLVRSDDTVGQDPLQTNATGDLARVHGIAIRLEIGNTEEDGHET